MCFTMSVAKDWKYIQTRFSAEFEKADAFQPLYYQSAFNYPAHPVITEKEPGYIQMYNWGLIPSWVKDHAQADAIRKQTINARSDTIFTKPSYKSSIMDKRCIIIADGFFEWHEEGSKKYPYYITMRNKEAFAIAGIWDKWTRGSEDIRTFSLITTDANPLLAKIHNVKKRMPAILNRDDEKTWLDRKLDRENIGSLLRSYDENLMDAYTVSHLVTAKSKERNVTDVIAPFDYEELSQDQKKLF